MSYEQLSSAKAYASLPENPAAAMSPEWRRQCLRTLTRPSRKCVGSRCRRCQSRSFAKRSKHNVASSLDAARSSPRLCRFASPFAEAAPPGVLICDATALWGKKQIWDFWQSPASLVVAGLS
ncbi:hypothetical protein TIFTF001_038584 [Ficus carica]|uniref:Uncharacterized protein n=1 Tax=Ficus carica TaxID=3494 RepID=A0AA88E7K4_FICCA|nr:hypothetical protein TIFTF001_038584 [Ficus carica]